MSVRAVAFDLGRVLVGLDPTWPLQIGVPLSEMSDWMYGSEALHAFERGMLSSDRFHAALSERFGCSQEASRAAFCAWVTGPLEGATALLEGVTVPSFALSNTNADHWGMFDPERHLRSRLVCLASHHLGARKPERAIYERASAIIGHDDVLFLDDRPENVEAARRWGWRAEVVVGISDCQTVLQEAGVLG